MVILIDTNIALDFLTIRQPYDEDAGNVIRYSADGQIKGCPSAELPGLAQ